MGEALQFSSYKFNLLYLFVCEHVFWDLYWISGANLHTQTHARAEMHNKISQSRRIAPSRHRKSKQTCIFIPDEGIHVSGMRNLYMEFKVILV